MLLLPFQWLIFVMLAVMHPFFGSIESPDTSAFCNISAVARQEEFVAFPSFAASRPSSIVLFYRIHEKDEIQFFIFVGTGW